MSGVSSLSIVYPYYGAEYKGVARLSNVQYICFFWLPNSGAAHNNSIALNRAGDTCPQGTRYNPTIDVCTQDEQKGAPPPGTCAGNPINFSVGNKFQLEMDYRSKVSPALSFNRNYNSLDGLWRHNYSSYLRFADAVYVSFVMADGRESFFSISGDVVAPISSDQGVLNKTSTGWQYTSVDNERFVFD
ncbi:DUF6531 domain-containing protein, partial [Pseudomonas indica]|uniref:DUF6531 domain-containing protein n=1 Tax=Pseudomonas indica TaxID=137658 RepID=UPI0023F6BA0A